MAPRLIIRSATYGGKDVTTIVQQAADKFTLELPVNNDTLGGDPTPGKGKTLSVDWSMGAEQGTTTAREGRTLIIHG